MKKIQLARVMVVFVALFSLLHIFYMGYITYVRNLFLKAAAEKTVEMHAVYTKFASFSPKLENISLVISVILFIALMVYIVYCVPKMNVTITGILACILIPAVLLVPFTMLGMFGLYDVYFLAYRGFIYSAPIIVVGLILYLLRKNRKDKGKSQG